MICLPQEFKERMQRQMGDEYPAFLASYEKECNTGLRVNTGKIRPEELTASLPFALQPVPWTANGFYYRKEDGITRHPYYFAGLYYVQEPSAMLPASRLPIAPGDVVLDLCAAPGGKATELSSRLDGTGLLIANDASASRAKALFKNLALWGSQNCCITAETPQRLLEAFGCCFDKILVDAPCSGEGMFRKDSSLIAAWKERGPDSYASLQREILSCAVQMLKPGGMLLYSTCTFSQEEDEETVGYLLEQFPKLTLVQPAMQEGFSCGMAPYERCIRLWPHRVRGEGHFLALFQKSGPESGGLRRYTPQELEKSQAKLPPCAKEFLEQLSGFCWKDFFCVQAKEQCLLLPPYRIPGGLRYLRTGILAGTCKNGRFEPSQQLAMLLDRDSWPDVLDLSPEDERVVRYLKGETISLSHTEASKSRGWVLVCVDGHALGWGKYAGETIKNKYYPGWRLQ